MENLRLILVVVLEAIQCSHLNILQMKIKRCMRQEFIRRAVRKLVRPDMLSINHEVDDYEADHALNGVLPGWSLSRDSHYQLANRFAWAWKLADMGLPTILIYLGFLNAAEMKDQGHHFIDHSQ